MAFGESPGWLPPVIPSPLATGRPSHRWCRAGSIVTAAPLNSLCPAHRGLERGFLARPGLPASTDHARPYYSVVSEASQVVSCRQHRYVSRRPGTFVGLLSDLYAWSSKFRPGGRPGELAARAWIKRNVKSGTPATASASIARGVNGLAQHPSEDRTRSVSSGRLSASYQQRDSFILAPPRRNG
jgi:hypothetical protein